MPVPTVTPASPLAREGKSATNFTSNQSVTWAASGGTLSNVTSTSATWTAPNVTGTYTLTATNAGSEVRTITITVTAVFPAIYLDWNRPIKKKKKVLLFEPEEGADQTRGKGSARVFREIGCEDSPVEHFEELDEFWNAHYGHSNNRFIFTNPITGVRALYSCDADLNIAERSPVSVSWNSSIKETYPFGVEV